MKEKHFQDMRLKIRQFDLINGFDLTESATYLNSLPNEVFSSYVLAKKISPGPLLQPRGGFARFEDQRELTHLFNKAGSDFIPLTIDSHTRQNDYERAKYLLNQSEESGLNLLNGYPLIAHGAATTRLLFKDILKPISLRHGTPDARLLVETALDAGITEIEGGGLCYCLPYSRSYPIDRALLNWQYVDKLCANLSSFERPIHRESFGALTATMVPPFMVVVVQILELLLAAEQGVSSFSVSFSQSASMKQDIATAKALREISNYYLKKTGWNAKVYLVFHQWMGAFPKEREYADALIVNGATISALCNADKVVIKTRNEALGIPDAQSNVDAVRATRYAIGLCFGSTDLIDKAINEEADAICRAAKFIIDEILNYDAPLWEQVAWAVRKGIIDIPFSPHQQNLNKIWTKRDKNKAIRVSDPGLVPLPKEFIKREQSLLADSPGGSILDKSLNDILVMLKNTS